MSHVNHLIYLALPALLAGCAAPQGEYPSLAVRDTERVSGTMEVAPPPPPPPAQPPATLERLDQLVADARASHTQFLAAAPAARTSAQAAGGAATGSDSWGRAQVAIADLEARRSNAMIALADLDRLYVNAASAAEDLTPIVAARDEIGALVDEQNSIIDSLLGELQP
ncbi:hypothetical protein [Aurantiacibacter gilvus]|uniref:DUF4398 domain-containing protein n=1 Tax=Aurantiacibacter gilvus TaxID=3139141 RepID=A0ABU9IEI5_9SPHN